MLKYEIKLTNVWWEERGVDTRYFDDLETQQYYFNNLPGDFSNLVNFPMGDNIRTTITYKDNTSRNIDEIVASNYAIVKRTYEENGVIEESYRYYFAKCSQDSGRQIIVELSLDDVQTNYFRFKDNIAQCNIRRACLNRFNEVENDSTKVVFNGDADSPLFENEGIEVSKRLVSREKVINKSDLVSESVVDKWVNDNVIAWSYLLVQGNKKYNFKNIDNTTAEVYLTNVVYSTDEVGYEGIEGTGAIIAVPILKKNKNLYLVDESEWNLSSELQHKINISSIYGFNSFRGSNDDTSFFYNYKLTLKNLLDTTTYVENTDYKIVSGDLYIKGVILTNGTSRIGENFGLRTHLEGVDTPTIVALGYGVLYLPYDRINRECEELEVDHDFEFEKSEIVGSNKDYKFNPKLYSSSFIDVVLNNGNGVNYSYDLQKLNSNKISLKYSEALTGDVSKGYTRLSKGSGLYDSQTSVNFTGLLNSNDTSIPYDNGQLASFFANNKNFYMQSNVNMAIDAVSNIGKEAVAGAMVGGGYGAIGGALLGTITTGIDIGTKLINREFTIDNLRNSPNSLKNVNGNAIYTSLITDMSIYVEVYEGLEHELEVANDYMVKNGYVYNKIGNINDFVNIRKYFNYLSADVEVINAPISLEEKRRLIERFKEIRFWNVDVIQYDLENYERWLEDEEE